MRAKDFKDKGFFFCEAPKYVVIFYFNLRNHVRKSTFWFYFKSHQHVTKYWLNSVKSYIKHFRQQTQITKIVLTSTIYHNYHQFYERVWSKGYCAAEHLTVSIHVYRLRGKAWDEECSSSLNDHVTISFLCLPFLLSKVIIRRMTVERLLSLEAWQCNFIFSSWRRLWGLHKKKPQRLSI